MKEKDLLGFGNSILQNCIKTLRKMVMNKIKHGFGARKVQLESSKHRNIAPIDRRRLVKSETMRIILLNIILCTVVFAQHPVNKWGSVCGTLISSVDSLPIEESFVLLRWTGLSTSSDSWGYFRIDSIPFSSYHLQIIGSGYLPIDSIIVVHDIIPLTINFTLQVDRDTLDAIRDIKLGDPKLLLAGGIAPVIFRADTLFEHRFKVRYYDFGDTVPAYASIRKYNRIVFAYLDKLYGNTWRVSVRKDVLFLK